MKQWEIIFHGLELGVLVFGVAAPMIWSAMRIRSILKDFPPHRHVSHRIVYPRGYEPTRTQVERSDG